MTARGTLVQSLLFACMIVIAGPAAPDNAGHPVSMWQIEGNSNRIYVLGSLHMLREQDHPIPTAIEEAYKDAEILIMEVDMDDIDEIEIAGLVIELGVIGDSGSLQEYMGQELYAEAEHYASQLKIPIAMLGQTEPWLAAITVEQMMLLRLGFNPQYGIELHLMAKAVKDEKEVLGFETAREQLEFLDGLSLPMQRLLLLQTLKDNLNIEEDLNLLISAWRHGDIGFLEETLLAEMQKFPELYKTLVVNRNQAWVEKIINLTTKEDDYLIIVGALHLVGEDGLPALLSEAGINANQLREPET